MLSIAQDISYALRSLRRRRGFTAVAITTIALGIGAATSMYSVVDGVLFRPLPYRDASRLTAVWQTYPEWRGDPVLGTSWDRISLSLPDFKDWQATQRSFDAVAVWSTRGGVSLGTTDAPQSITVMRASASMLSVLGVQPEAGRYFSPAEDQLGAPRVTMVTHEAWESRFSSDPAIVGRVVRFDDEPYTIIGVLPAGLSLYRLNTTGGMPPFWIPALQETRDATNRDNHSYQGIGRVNAGITVADAARETDRIFAALRPDKVQGVRLEQWQVDQTRDVRKPLLVLLGAVGLLLLIACVNVAILLLGEASMREPEIAARMALGAGRPRVVRQLLTESVALAALGSAAGTALAWFGTRALVALAPPRIPGLADVTMDVRVLAFALTAAVATGVLFGLAPAIGLARSSPGAVFRGNTGQSARGRGGLQQGLVAIEIALSLVLLVGAALLARSLDRMTAVDPGFRADHLVTARVSLPRAKYGDSTLARGYYRDAVARLAAVPGVIGVTGSSNAPFAGGNSSHGLLREADADDAPRVEAEQRTVLPAYFDVMSIPVVAGRTFNETDRTGGALVVVVSRMLAEALWPGESPLGRRVRFQGSLREVVGVVGDTKYSRLSADLQPMIYAPLSQRAWNNVTFLVRTGVDPASVSDAIHTALKEIDPAVPFLGSDTMESLVRRTSVEERYRTTLVSLFGMLAAVLAAVGMYGVTSRAASRRTREMGIRIALGARGRNVVRLLVRSTFGGVVIGVTVGLVGSVLAGRWLNPFLFGVTPSDAIAFGGSIALLVTVSLVATWLPARRAARVPPAIVLRSD